MEKLLGEEGPRGGGAPDLAETEGIRRREAAGGRRSCRAAVEALGRAGVEEEAGNCSSPRPSLYIGSNSPDRKFRSKL